MRFKQQIIFLTLLTPFYLLLFQLIHELFHCVTAILTGNIVLDIHYIYKQDYIFGSLSAISYIEYFNLEYKWLVVLSGSLGSVILSSIFFCIGIKKRSAFLIFNHGMFLSMEFSYWAYNPFIKSGDPFYFYKEIGIINFIPLSVIFFICVIGIYTIFCNFLWKFFKNSLEVHYNEKNKNKINIIVYDY